MARLSRNRRGKEGSSEGQRTLYSIDCGTELDDRVRLLVNGVLLSVDL